MTMQMEKGQEGLEVQVNNMEEEYDIFQLINEECELDDRWLEECEREERLKSIDKKTKK